MSIQALCGIVLFRLFLLSGLTFTTAQEAGILTGATPAITALLAMVLLKESANGRKVAGIICTVGGICLLQGILTSGTNLSIGHFTGNLLVLCAAGCESLFNIFSRSFALKATTQEKSMINTTVQTTIVTAIALVICMLLALMENPVTQLSKIGVVEWLALLWYGVFVTAVAFICWYGGIKRCGAFMAASFSGMMPVTAMLLSVGILGESIAWNQWAGGLLIITSMGLIGSSAIDLKRPIKENTEQARFESNVNTLPLVDN
jgi:drug/metabolite transporter (DMT)-like permease